MFGPAWAQAQPARPRAGRRTARRPGPASGGGRDRGGRDQPTRRPARPTTQTVENALRAGVLGCVCAHGRSPRHPGRGRQLAGGVAPTGRIGVASAGPLHNQLQRPWNPSTTSFSSAGGKRRLRALESVWMHWLLAARVAVGLERRRGRNRRCHYLYTFSPGRSGPRGRRPPCGRRPRPGHGRRPGSNSKQPGWRVVTRRPRRHRARVVDGRLCSQAGGSAVARL